MENLCCLGFLSLICTISGFLVWYNLFMPEPDASPPKIIALLPAYNEAVRIVPVLESVLVHLPALVVDDGSTDQTAEFARAAGAQVILQQPNAGKGAALRAGFRRAIQDGYDAVVTLDSDGQHDPEDLPAFLIRYGQIHSDLIIGYRDFRLMPLSRRLANTAGRLAFSWALGQFILDNQSGYRLISKRMMEATLNSQEEGFEFEVEMIQICLKKGFTLSWVPIKTIYAGEESHIRPIPHVQRFLHQVWLTRQARFKKE
jgi:glycosyltransferase involved in cell wall biosynthesis